MIFSKHASHFTPPINFLVGSGESPENSGPEKSPRLHHKFNNETKGRKKRRRKRRRILIHRSPT